MANPDIFGRFRQFNKDFNKIFLIILWIYIYINSFKKN